MKSTSTIKSPIIISSIILLCVYCTNPDLKKALKEAGKNREQLEKVLKHYRNDNEKFKAACFLIENMPQYNSYYSKDIELYKNLFHQFDSLQKFEGAITNAERDSLIENFKSYNGEFGVSEIKLLPDVQNIKAGYLIENIDLAFYVWKNMPWAKHLNFDEFCEYILPYRIKDEQLTNWREYLFKKYGWICNHTSDTTNPAEVLSKLMEIIEKYFVLDNDFSVYPFNLSFNELIAARRGICENRVNYITLSSRSLGIPMVCDYVPQWGNRSMSHIWYTTFTKEGKQWDFLIDGIDRYNIEGVDYGIPKVYRLTFKMQKDVPANIEKDHKYLPGMFLKKNFIDVTKDYEKYVTVHDVEIKLQPTFSVPAKLAYLCVFDNSKWIPVSWGEIKNRQIKFRDMGSDLVYLPAVFIDDCLIPVANPFILYNDGKITELKPEKDVLQTVTVNRKYPLKPRIRGYINRMKHGWFEASNNANFNEAKILYKIDETPKSSFSDIEIKVSEKYRYFRYVSPEGSFGDVAEIGAYSGSEKLNGILIGIPGKKGNPIKNAFDGDNLSFYEADMQGGAWIGLDLRQMKKITRIKYLPRNDQNDIQKGLDYELFYWNSEWISLGRKIAGSGSMSFNNVPSNGLYFLHCHSGGREERIFTFEKGKQVWW